MNKLIDNKRVDLWLYDRYIQPLGDDGYTRFKAICADCHNEFLLRLEDLMGVRLGLRECRCCHRMQNLVEESLENVKE